MTSQEICTLLDPSVVWGSVGRSAVAGWRRQKDGAQTFIGKLRTLRRCVAPLFSNAAAACTPAVRAGLMRSPRARFAVCRAAHPTCSSPLCAALLLHLHHASSAAHGTWRRTAPCACLSPSRGCGAACCSGTGRRRSASRAMSPESGPRSAWGLRRSPYSSRPPPPSLLLPLPMSLLYTPSVDNSSSRP